MSNKDETLYCRLDAALKARIEAEASTRGESASVVVREALREYFASRSATGGQLREEQTIYQVKPTPKANRAAA